MTKQLNYFVHHVFFWLKKPVTRKTRTTFENGLKKLVTIEVIAEKHLGTPATTKRGVVDRSYSYSLLVTFRS
jgi:hypothetical protein